MADADTAGAEPAAQLPGGAAVSIRQLFKIYGPEPQHHLAAVRQGMDKVELREKHGHVLGLRDISLDIAAGQIQVVMGLSGSGKSTLIRHINRLVEPSAGAIHLQWDGRVQDITGLGPSALQRFRRELTAMVFQRYALLPHLSVLDNAAYGLQIRGLGERERHARARPWIDRVGLAGYESHFPHQLSGGMQQRVGLARALAHDAPLLLMDEPFSALDPLIRAEMQTLLLGLQQEVGKTIVFITHDLDEALRLGDQVAILHEGELLQQGPAEQIVLQPANEHVRAFAAQVNRGRVLRCRSLLRPGQAVAAGLSLSADTTLGAAAQQMQARQLDAANLHDAMGRHLGRLALSDILAAIWPADGSVDQNAAAGIDRAGHQPP